MDIVRSWKDLDYREGLTEEELAGAPAHPAGVAALSGTDLDRVVGAGTQPMLTFGCCGVGTPAATFTFTIPVWCIVSLNFCP